MRTLGANHVPPGNRKASPQGEKVGSYFADATDFRPAV
jgi:hypothetical protein